MPYFSSSTPAMRCWYNIRRLFFQHFYFALLMGSMLAMSLIATRLTNFWCMNFNNIKQILHFHIKPVVFHRLKVIAYYWIGAFQAEIQSHRVVIRSKINKKSLLRKKINDAFNQSKMLSIEGLESSKTNRKMFAQWES